MMVRDISAAAKSLSGLRGRLIVSSPKFAGNAHARPIESQDSRVRNRGHSVDHVRRLARLSPTSGKL